MAIQIVTDSTADFSPRELQKLDITMIPLRVVFGDRVYRDGEELSCRDFYNLLASSPTLPTTSQPPMADFLPYFEAAKCRGDSVICLLISSRLSGTVQSALAAKSLLGYEKIYIVDSLSVMIGLRLLVTEAVRLRDLHRSAEEIAARCESLCSRLQVFGVVDTLTYLHKGGRISGAVSLVGGMLSIKPILQLKDGEISMLSKARGTERTMDCLLGIIEALPPIDRSLPVIFGYSENTRLGAQFEKKACNRLNLRSGGLFSIGSVVGAHTGPGAFAVAFVTDATHA